MKKPSIIFIILTVLSTLTYCYANPPDLIHEYQLPNGLKIIVKENHRAPIVTSEVWYKVGSSYETEGLTGISHMLEHMMFDGTKAYPNGMFSKIIAEIGGTENANTSYDYTFYYQQLAADKLPISLKLEADRMQNLTLLDKVYEREHEVVKEERRLRIDNNPQALTFEQFATAAYIVNPYRHPIAGWMRDLNNMTLEDVRHWYNQWYAPNNAVLVVAGDVDPDKVFELAKQYFGSIPPKTLPNIKPQTGIPLITKRTISLKLPAKQPLIMIAYNVPSLKTAKEKWQSYTLQIINALLAGSDSSRLTKELIRKQQLASAVDSDYGLYNRLDTLLILYAIPNPSHNLKEIQQALFAEIKKLQTEPVSQEELARIKNKVIAQKIFAQDSLQYQATELGIAASLGLDLKMVKDYVKEIGKVTPEQIKKVSQMYFTPERLTIAHLIPEKSIKGGDVNQVPTLIKSSGEQDVH